MAITREKKEELIQKYKQHIDDSSGMIFTDYRGISVAQIQELRSKLGGSDASYVVVKNRLFKRALEESGQEQPEEFLDGPNAIVFLSEDLGQGVTALKDWMKDDGSEIVEIKGGLLDSSVLDAKGAEALADLPTKEQTLAMILGVLSAPSGDLVRIVNAPASSLARVLNARAEQLKEAA